MKVYYTIILFILFLLLKKIIFIQNFDKSWNITISYYILKIMFNPFQYSG